MKAFGNPAVAARFETYPAAARQKLLAVRALVFQVAETTEGVGEIEETLKWGEPAYVTRNGSGSTVRIDWKKADPDHYAMYFNCQTHLVETFRALFPDDFRFEGNRALLFSLADELPHDALASCVMAALTYHRNRKARRSRRAPD